MKILYGLTMDDLKTLETELEAKIEALTRDLESVRETRRVQERYSRGEVNPIIESPLKASFPTAQEIREAVISIDHNFLAADIPAIIKKMFPSKNRSSKNLIGTVLHSLVKEGELDYARERSGRTPAIYCKASKKKTR